MEKFHQGDQVLDKYDRPEDELETPEVVAVNKRERAFNAEGGFRNLLRLKIVAEDLKKEEGVLRNSSIPDFIQQIIDDPKKYAYSELGFDSNKEEIPDNELQSALKNFLEESKISSVAEIDRYLPIIIGYESTTQSEALKALKWTLEECKKSALNGDWGAFCKQATQANSYFRGIEDIVELCCGTAVEDESTRKILDADRKK